MRAIHNPQNSLFDPEPIDHPVADDLDWASDWLDAHPELLDAVAADLGATHGSGRGRHGLTCETVLRCAVLLHLRQASYRELAFTLVDSRSAQRFARLDPSRRPPKKSVLQATVGALRAATWETINRRLLDEAQKAGVEKGAAAIDFHDHCRAAKRRSLEAGSKRGAERRAKVYRKLLRLTGQTRGYVENALPRVRAVNTLWSAHWVETAEMYLELLDRVIDQTERRVFRGEKVPAAEKVVSLFEPHTDIIVKSKRGTHYGHKINLSTGRSGLVLDAVVEDGNPADSARCLPMLERHVEHYGKPPSRAAFDGGYASRENLEKAKDLGIEHVVFHKKRGMKAEDMTPSSWLYRRLKNFRAGVEANISYLKRCFGPGRCLWRGLKRFTTYVHSAVFAHNLMRLARLRPKLA